MLNEILSRRNIKHTITGYITGSSRLSRNVVVFYMTVATLSEFCEGSIVPVW